LIAQLAAAHTLAIHFKLSTLGNSCTKEGPSLASNRYYQHERTDMEPYDTIQDPIEADPMRRGYH